MPTTNWNQIFENTQKEAKKFEPLPDGEYPVVCVQVDLAQTKNGDDRFNLRWKVIEGDHKGRILFDGLNVIPDNSGSMGIFFDRYASLGYTFENFFSSEPTNDQIKAAPLGKVIIGKIEISREKDGTERVFNGKKSNDFKKYLPADARLTALGQQVYAGVMPVDTPTSGGAIPGAVPTGVPSALPTPTPAAAPEAPPTPVVPEAPAAPPAAAPEALDTPAIPPAPPKPY